VRLAEAALRKEVGEKKRHRIETTLATVGLAYSGFALESSRRVIIHAGKRRVNVQFTINSTSSNLCCLVELKTRKRASLGVLGAKFRDAGYATVWSSATECDLRRWIRTKSLLRSEVEFFLNAVRGQQAWPARDILDIPTNGKRKFQSDQELRRLEEIARSVDLSWRIQFLIFCRTTKLRSVTGVAVLRQSVTVTRDNLYIVSVQFETNRSNEVRAKSAVAEFALALRALRFDIQEQRGWLSATRATARLASAARLVPAVERAADSIRHEATWY
jgi:hypothetical protein